MQRKRRPEREDEPEVTFELEETPRVQRGGHAGAAGAAAVAGAGLVSSASASELDESLDVFDQFGAEAEGAEAVPVTSFQELTDEPDSDFPPIDFAASDAALDTDESTSTAGEAFGATAEVGGGFVLDETTGAEAFGVPDSDFEPVADTLTDDAPLDDSQELDEDVPDDIDLS